MDRPEISAAKLWDKFRSAPDCDPLVDTILMHLPLGSAETVFNELGNPALLTESRTRTGVVAIALIEGPSNGLPEAGLRLRVFKFGPTDVPSETLAYNLAKSNQRRVDYQDYILKIDCGFANIDNWRNLHIPVIFAQENDITSWGRLANILYVTYEDRHKRRFGQFDPIQEITGERLGTIQDNPLLLSSEIESFLRTCSLRLQ